MFIFYGDYKDLNFVNDRNSTINNPGDAKQLMPLWKKFQSGESALTQDRVTNDMLLKMPKIIIRNQTYEETQYTSYTLVRGTNYRTSLSHYKAFPNKFIDKENGFIILEVDESCGYVPKSLEDVKEREIAYNKKKLSELENSTNFTEEMLDIQKKFYEDNIAKWEAKTEARWFHETELTIFNDKEDEREER